MWSQICDWAFHWLLLWFAFQLGKRWNEKDVAASIAALTETQSRRRSQEINETPVKERKSPRGSPQGSPTSTGSPPSSNEKRRLSRPVLTAIHTSSDTNGELRPLIMANMVTPTKPSPAPHVTEAVMNEYLNKLTNNELLSMNDKSCH